VKAWRSMPTALVVMLALMPARATAPTVVIGAGRLVPPVLEVAIDQRVTFVNDAARVVHVDFVGHAGEHHVFQVPGRIWAVFHRTGRHPYVVHFESGRGEALRGAVDVVQGAEPGDPPTCNSVTVMGVCLER